MTYTLPKLPYAYNALEPFMDEETVHIHHDKHHQAYVNNANIAIEGLSPELQALPADALLRQLDKVPADKLNPIRNNVGGHVNHTFFWELLKPGTELKGELKAAIERDFGSVDVFKAEFEKAAATRFGSGWAWLIVKDGKLSIVSTSNQETPIMGEKFAGVSGEPILTIDVWEHAYYLKFQNRRPDFIHNYWNIVNWDKVAELFAAEKK